MNSLIKILAKSGLLKDDLDYHLIDGAHLFALWVSEMV